MASEGDDASSLDGSAKTNIFADGEGGGAGGEGGAGEGAGAAPLAEEEAEAEAEEEDDDYIPDDELGPAGAGGVLVRYGGADWIEGVPSRDDIVAEEDDRGVAAGGVSVSGTLPRQLSAGRPVFFMPVDVFFMPVDVEETSEYVRGKPYYALRLFGPLLDGSKAEVLITGIDVFFDVREPAKGGPAKGGQGGPAAAFDAHLRQVLADADAADARLETVQAFPGSGYHPAPVRWTRVHLPSLQQRKKALLAVRQSGLETASDDRSSYYRKAAREYGFPLSDWALLSGYEYCPGGGDKSPLTAHVFRVPVEGYRPFDDVMAPKEKRELAAKAKASTPLLQRDRTLVLAWDIETHSERGLGDLPDAVHDKDNAFMICLTAHWKDDPAALRRVCIVDAETAPDPRWTTVVCGSPANVLRAFALCWRALAPDVVTGFNDSDYDWPFVVEKARRLDGRLLGWMMTQMTAVPRRSTTTESVLQWNYVRAKPIKITPEEIFYSSFLKVPGCVPIDARVCYKKLFPKSETPKAGSLKFFLAAVGLPGKADMPVKRMWRIREAAMAAETPAERAAAAEPMRHVAHYCVVDALRCQALLVRRGVVSDYREVASLAFVSLFDAHYYAGGMKVCNLLAAYAWRRNMLVSMIPRERAETGKYPGAYVFPPEKGLTPDPGRVEAVEAAAARLRGLMAAGAGAEGARAVAEAEAAVAAALAAFAHDRPVTGLDFASLYPSLIMAYNLSPEKILLTAEEAAALRAAGADLHPIEFPYNGRQVTGWSIRHGNRPQDLGLFPTVLIDLFNKRAEVKVELGKHAQVKERAGLVLARAKKDSVSVATAARLVLADALASKASTDAALAPGAPPPRISPGATLKEELDDLQRLNKIAKGLIEWLEPILQAAVPALTPTTDAAPAEVASSATSVNKAADAAIAAAIADRLAAAEFSWADTNKKQNALKVYMNTFYGETGNSLSAFFLLQLAGGVTSAGQYNIKLVADCVREKGFLIKYGDTDSLYLVPPARYFSECDAEFVAGRFTREEWWSAMVRITIRALNQVRDEVNAFLKADNGTGYLKMAYEEVLYPVVFAGKKKYYGIPHLNEVNFRPRALFIKGIDIVKQGQPKLALDIGSRIMWGSMALDNARGIRRHVEDVLRDAVLNGAQWGFDHFVKTSAWRPHKNNVSVHRFIARMRARIASMPPAEAALYELPAPGERFSFVVAKPGTAFDLRGRRLAPRMGDRMEFARVARALNIEVDVAYYITAYVAGLCARFINGDAEFQPPAGHAAGLTPKKTDEFAQKAAKKHLEGFVKGLGEVSGEVLRRRGTAYRRAFGRAAEAAVGALCDVCGPAGADVLHGAWLDYEVLVGGEDEAAADPVARTVNALWASAEAYARQVCAEGAKDWCAEVGEALGIAPDGSDTASRTPGAGSAGSSGASSGASSPALPRKGGTAHSPRSGGPPSPASSLYRVASPGATRQQRALKATLLAAGLDRCEAAARAELAGLAPALTDVATRYEASLAQLVERVRGEEHAAHPEIGESAEAPVSESAESAEGAGANSASVLPGITAADTELLAATRRAWFGAVGIAMTRRREEQFAGHLAALKDRRLKVVRPPTQAEIRAAVSSAAAGLRVSGEIAATL